MRYLFGATLVAVLIVPAAALSLISPAPVDIGTSGDFIIMAKSGISTTATTEIWGDIGVSPAAASGITGFGLIMNNSGAFSVSSKIDGNVYAFDYTDPTPTKVTTAVRDMETAYNNAAGRTLPDYAELYAGDITGQTLTPGLYSWGTSVHVSADGVTVSGSTNDVWIFQVAEDLILSDGATVTLTGGAHASNIFWQVAGKVTLGTTAAMKGIILCQTKIAMDEGARLDGRALAQTEVTLDANVVTIFPATTAIGKNDAVPDKTALFQNYSNQFIEFSVPSNGKTTLTVMDVRGRNVATLFSGEMEAGKYNQVQFNTDMFPRGVYFSRLHGNENVNVEKILLVK